MVAGSLALLSITPANAVSPDSLYPLSGVWSAPRVMKEYFDWRGYVGWGTVSTVDLIIQVGVGASQGQFTKAAFTGLCGSVAAGVLGTWKPVSEPTVASHLKAIMKAGGVKAVATACGWASYAVFNVIDAETKKAQDAINHKVTAARLQEISNDAKNINNDLLAMEGYYHQIANALNNANAWRGIVNQTCRSSETAYSCNSARQSLKQALATAQTALNNFNHRGVQLHADLTEINHDIPS